MSILNLRLDGGARPKFAIYRYPCRECTQYDQGCTSIRVGINGPREPARSQTQGDARIKCRVSAAPFSNHILGRTSAGDKRNLKLAKHIEDAFPQSCN